MELTTSQKLQIVRSLGPGKVITSFVSQNSIKRFSGFVSDVTWPPVGNGVLPQDDFRNRRMKLVPHITTGPWFVQMTVGYVDIVTLLF